MRKLFGSILIVVASAASAQSMPSIWEVSPLSPANSPLTWENSPLNWDNSIVSSKNNGVYHGAGRRIGYATETPSGATNVYLNNGHRIGYIPQAERRRDLVYEPYSAPTISDSLGPSYINPAVTTPERQTRRSRRDDEDDDDMPIRHAAIRAGIAPAPLGGFTPIAQPAPRSGFAPVAPAPMKTGFIPLEESEPVRSGFTPLAPPKSGFTPLK